MNWKQVNLIFRREMIDQLRDRRTLFTITILPLLLYPLLGLLMMQVAQFNREYAVRVRVVGLEHWPQDLRLLDKQLNLIPRSNQDNLPKLLEFETTSHPGDDPESVRGFETTSKRLLESDEVDVILVVEPEFSERLYERLAETDPDKNVEATALDNPSLDNSALDNTALNNPAPEDAVLEDAALGAVASSGLAAAVSTASGKSTAGGASKLQSQSNFDGLRLITNLARDRSQVAQRRLATAINAWQEEWVAMQLESAGMNPRLVEPLRFTQKDTAVKSVRRALLWSKVLPFVMLIWALTGAFYPAVDLCAGEKERGTLETLLSSPARRQEIVWGKLFTVCVFSVGSALLNLLSMHVTAGIIVKRLAAAGTPNLAETLGPMPIHALGWLLLLLLPMAAFFSALALAVAALARSTKEGQYYLMPLLLVTLPLVALPMIPSLELSLGTSLVPVSGAVFLVRSLIEGRYTEALLYLPSVLLVTVCCCSLAIRWAIRQFESESVMFRESDRWNFRLWIHQLWRDRGETASPTEALMCGVIILISMFFAQFLAGTSIETWADVVKSTVTVQLGIILTPCLLMAIFLTRSVRRALRIHRTQPSHLIAATVIGVALHPAYLTLGNGIGKIYEISPETAELLTRFQIMVCSQPLWAILLVMAVLPAVCEELAFRGLIFGGLLRGQGALRAIVVSALFFGFTHTILQQSIAASLMGLVLGLIAWRTGGVICTIIVHAVNNSLSLSLAWLSQNEIAVPTSLTWAIELDNGSWGYSPTWVTLSILLSLGLFAILFKRSRVTQHVVQAEMA